ncbi:ATP-binding protein [Streptomyces sp. HUAS MG91]|uniref:ATP-binding protein n=1 Tax=Streptomyces tabacisoli TaxID=3156398 RepID=A0AAU8J1U9_9ACTN
MPPLRPIPTSGAAGSLEQVIALDGGSGCISEARDAARRFLSEARDEHRMNVPDVTVENAQLVVSELVTNLIKYAPGPGLLQLRIDDSGVQVEVWDSGPAQPLVHGTDPHRVGQHGLEIVTLLTESLTVHSTTVGKRIVATLALPDA